MTIDKPLGRRMGVVSAAEYLSRPRAWAICLALIVIAAVFRLVAMSTVFATVDSDEGVLGIMALHIQQGDRPIFYYRQVYTSSFEAYLAAPIFHLFGANDLTVRLPALLFSLVLVGVVFWLGVLLYGGRIAVLSALFVALGPGLLVNWGTIAGANYIEVAVCGGFLLLLALLFPDLQNMPPWVAVISGFVIGFGVWLQPMMVQYLAPVAIFYAARLLQARRSAPLRWGAVVRSLGLGIVGACIGVAPLLLYNLRHNWQTVTYLMYYGRGGNHGLAAVQVVTDGLPQLLGLVVPTPGTDSYDSLSQLVALHPLPYLIGLLLGALILIRFVCQRDGVWRRVAALLRSDSESRPVLHSRAEGHVSAGATIPWFRPHGERDGVLALFVVCSLLFYILSHYATIHASTISSRYLLPLYTATPLVFDLLLPRRPKRAAIVTASTVLGILLLISSSLTFAATPRTSITPLVQRLEADGVRAFYSNDYWLVYRISFESHERIIGVGVQNSLHIGLIRVSDYVRAARRVSARQIAWIFYRLRPDGERNFRRILRRYHISTRRFTWKSWTVYDNLSRPLYATGNYVKIDDHL